MSPAGGEMERPGGAPARARPTPRRRRGGDRVLLTRAVAGCALAIGLTGAAALAGLPTAVVLAPVVLAVLAACVWLALTRFELLVLLMLSVRAGVDSVGGLGPASVNVAMSLALLVAGLVWLAGDIRAGGRRTLTAGPSLALLGAGALSLIASPDRLASVTELLRVASGLLMLELVQRVVRDERGVGRLLAAVLASAAVPVAVGLFQWASGEGRLIGDFVRVTGSFRHPNPFAIYLVLVLLTCVAMLPHVGGRWKVALVAVAVPAGVCLLATYTRGGWIGLGVGVVVIAVLSRSRVLLAGLAAVVVAVTLFVPSTVARFTDLGESQRASGATANSLVWRVEYWSDTARLAGGQPITGIGLGIVRQSTEEEKQPHNDFVRTTAELGVLGLGAYLWLLVALARTARAGLRGSPRGSRGLLRGGALALAGCLAAVVVISVTSNVLSQVVLLWYTAAVVGLAAPAAQSWASRAASPLLSRRPTEVLDR